MRWDVLGHRFKISGPVGLAYISIKPIYSYFIFKNMHSCWFPLATTGPLLFCWVNCSSRYSSNSQSCNSNNKIWHWSWFPLFPCLNLPWQHIYWNAIIIHRVNQMIITQYHCTHLSDFSPPSMLAEMKRQWHYQWQAIHPHAATLHATTGSSRCPLTLPIPDAPPRLALRPLKGGWLLAAGPQSRIPRNRPFRKPARKRPRAFGDRGHAHWCPSTRRGGSSGCQSVAESEVATQSPVFKEVSPLFFSFHFFFSKKSYEIVMVEY